MSQIMYLKNRIIQSMKEPYKILRHKANLLGFNYADVVNTKTPDNANNASLTPPHLI